MQERRFPVMGTMAHVAIVGGAVHLLDEAEQQLHRLEARWSRFDPSSEIAALNRNGGTPTVVSGETFRLVLMAIDAWHKTGGLFDPTIGTTMELAGYDRSFELLATRSVNGADRHEPPATPRQITLDPHCNAITVPAGLRFDLGGIAKGAAADRVALELLAGGAEGCCVNVGGDLRVAGASPSSGGWRVSIDGSGEEPTITVAVSDGAVCTSTTKKRRWTSPAGPEHHIRHPATGGSAASGLDTVSIVSATAAQAEVLAKAALLSGQTAGAAMVAAAEATGRFVTTTGETIMLAGMERFVVGEAPVTVV